MPASTCDREGPKPGNAENAIPTYVASGLQGFGMARLRCLACCFARQLFRSPLESRKVAIRQPRRVDTSLSQMLLGRRQRLCSAQGAPLLVEFSWLPTADGRPWLLA
jgi:hypothetical protein